MSTGKVLIACSALVRSAISVDRAIAREFFIGGPAAVNGMEIVANYLVGIEMAPMTHAMTMTGPDVVHIEADVHATAENAHRYPDGAWIGYLTISYRLEKPGSSFRIDGTLKPMSAADGPHYADNVRMPGPGDYTLTYSFHPPGSGYYRHVDKETGVPEWWTPFTKSFRFRYPQE
jgi:uncharacterized protein involved in high-affinity Fe2+ transport